MTEIVKLECRAVPYLILVENLFLITLNKIKSQVINIEPKNSLGSPEPMLGECITIKY